MEFNEFNQPVGQKLVDWHEPSRPSHDSLLGQYCRLDKVDPDTHAASLHAANALDREGRMWTYLPYGPFASPERYRLWLETISREKDPLVFAIIDKTTATARGLAAYLRIDPPHGCIEIGHLAFSPLLQRTTAATEALFLMIENAFALGYRRCEWKCNSLNYPSRAAAQRLGFSYEGLFRQAIIVKGRNRDTAWYSIIDKEWPNLQNAFSSWLRPDNFDSDGRQRNPLAFWTGPLLQHRDPALP